MTDIERYIALFNAGDYHAAHDALEPRWTRTRSEALHGLIQLAVGWHHLSHGNLHGARTLWTKALAHLEAATGDEGIDLVLLRGQLRAALALLPPGRRLAGPLPEGLEPPPLRRTRASGSDG